jgi:hypothetical protein
MVRYTHHDGRTALGLDFVDALQRAGLSRTEWGRLQDEPCGAALRNFELTHLPPRMQTATKTISTVSNSMTGQLVGCLEYIEPWLVSDDWRLQWQANERLASEPSTC